MWGTARRLLMASTGPLGWALADKARRDAVHTLMPEASALTVWRVAAQQAAHRARNALVRREQRYLGDARLEQAIEVRGREVLTRLGERAPLVVTWHSGTATALPAALAQCGRHGALIRFEPASATHHGFVTLESGRDPKQRARAMMHAITALRRKETVLFTAGVISRKKAPHPDHLMSFLGRNVYVAPGVATMARLGGAALVPALSRVEHGRVVVELFPPIAPCADDVATVRALVAFFAPHFARHPGELWSSELRWINASERLPQGP